MRGTGKIMDFPKYIINSGKRTIDPFPHVVQIKYPNGSIILIEEIDNKKRKKLEYNIKKKRFLFSPEIIYSASMDELQWSASFWPFDIDTLHAIPSVLCFFLRNMLCRMHKVEVISMFENRNFEEFFEKITNADGQIQEFSCSCVSYLQNLPNGIFPSPMLCIMTEAAVLLEDANSFKELISQIEIDLNNSNKHFGSPERSLIWGRVFRDLVQKYNSKVAEK